VAPAPAAPLVPDAPAAPVVPGVPPTPADDPNEDAGPSGVLKEQAPLIAVSVTSKPAPTAPALKVTQEDSFIIRVLVNDERRRLLRASGFCILEARINEWTNKIAGMSSEASGHCGVRAASSSVEDRSGWRSRFAAIASTP
jgi:hypothetical protein